MKYSSFTGSIFFMVNETGNRTAASNVHYSEADHISSLENIRYLPMLRNSTHRAEKRVAYISQPSTTRVVKCVRIDA